MVIESRWADFMQHYYLVCMCVQHICIKLLPYLVANILRYNSVKNEENWQSYCKNNRVIFFYTNITVAKTLQGRQLDKTCSVGYCISCCKIWCIHLQKAMRISWHEQTEKALFWMQYYCMLLMLVVLEIKLGLSVKKQLFHFHSVKQVCVN